MNVAAFEIECSAQLHVVEPDVPTDLLLKNASTHRRLPRPNILAKTARWPSANNTVQLPACLPYAYGLQTGTGEHHAWWYLLPAHAFDSTSIQKSLLHRVI